MYQETYLAKRLDWEKRRLDGRKKVSVTDESEFRKQDAAAKWLDEEWEQRRRKLAVIRKRQRPRKP
jgi:hypothetical protein